MSKELTQNKIMQAVDWAYEKAVGGVAGLDSATDMAAEYLRGSGTLEEKINSLIRWQNTKAGTSGFVTGLGGMLVMPVTIPANIASVMYVQIRMIAAIAKMCDQDLHSDRVKALVYSCLVGDGAKDILKDVGIVVGQKMTQAAINRISGKTIIAINQKVGFRLLTKAGEKGVINLMKFVPVVGGVIGGTVDAVTTNLIGNVARSVFLPLAGTKDIVEPAAEAI
jgi:uncharacterized protein (DUF697 family)